MWFSILATSPQKRSFSWYWYSCHTPQKFWFNWFRKKPGHCDFLEIAMGSGVQPGLKLSEPEPHQPIGRAQDCTLDTRVRNRPRTIHLRLKNEGRKTWIQETWSPHGPYQPLPQFPARDCDGDKGNADWGVGPGKVHMCGSHRAEWAPPVSCFPESPWIIIWTLVSPVEVREQGIGKKEKLRDFYFCSIFHCSWEAEGEQIADQNFRWVKKTAAGSHQPQKPTGKQGAREPQCQGTSTPTVALQ